MPANIEIKAHLRNRAAAVATAARLSASKPEIIHQEDIFFRCDKGRLKLRVFEPGRGELILYHRDDVAEVCRSNYSISRTSDPAILCDILTKTLGVVGSVRKTRTLFMVGQTRVHIDQVEGLGDFLELEVVLEPGQSDGQGSDIANKMLGEFGIDKSDLIADAYIDLLASKTR